MTEDPISLSSMLPNAYFREKIKALSSIYPKLVLPILSKPNYKHTKA
jgi:hypothetical protein